jgi:hypothetical protein
VKHAGPKKLKRSERFRKVRTFSKSEIVRKGSQKTHKVRTSLKGEKSESANFFDWSIPVRLFRGPEKSIRR